MTDVEFQVLWKRVRGELVTTIDPWWCCGAHSGIDRCIESGPDLVRLHAARRRASDIAQKQAKEEPWFPEAGGWHRGCLAAIDRVIWAVESAAARQTP